MENTEKVVYLDNAATTACAPEALAVMVEALSGACGNPSSHYSVAMSQGVRGQGPRTGGKGHQRLHVRDLLHRLRL